MEPVKSFLPIAKWMLRLALALLIYIRYMDLVLGFSFDSAAYFIAAGLVIFGVLLVAGGFTKKSDLTVVSGLLIFLLALIMVFIDNFSVNRLITHFPVAAMGFYFMARGNKN